MHAGLQVADEEGSRAVRRGRWEAIVVWTAVAIAAAGLQATQELRRGASWGAALTSAAQALPAWMMCLGSLCVLATLVLSQRRSGGKVAFEDAVVWMILGGFAAVMFLLGPLPLLMGGVYTYDDLAVFHVPVRSFYAESLANGDGFRWWPQMWCGLDLHGEGQGGFYHPLHLLMYRVLPLGTAIITEMTASYPLMFLGTAILLRRLGLGRAASMFGAFTFACSGPVVFRFHHLNGMAVVAHLPWLLILHDAVLGARSWSLRVYCLVGIAALTGSQLLLGYPQYVLISLWAEALFVISAAFSSRKLSAIPLVAIFKVIGATLGAVQLLPTYAALQTSTRGTAASSELALGSLAPVNFVQWVLPYLFPFRVWPGLASWQTHEMTVYAGVVPLVLLVLAVCGGLRPVRRLPVAYAIGLLATSSILALGEYSPLFPYLVRVPLLGSFRVSSRFMVLGALAIAILGGLAMELLLAAVEARPARKFRLSERPSHWLVPAACIVVAAAGSWWLHAAFTPARSVASGIIVALHPVVAGMLVGLWFFPAARRVALAGFVLFHVADLVRYDASFLLTAGAEAPGKLPIATVESLSTALDRETVEKVGEGRIASLPSNSFFNRATLQGVRLANGYVGLPPARNRELTDAEALRAAGVRLLFEDGAQRWIVDPYPPAWIGEPSEWIRPRADLAAEARIVARRNEEVTIETRCERDGVLVWSESYHAGWRAEIDGRETTVSRECGDFNGCAIPAGTHVVRFRFEPREFAIGRQLSVAALVGLLLLLVATHAFTLRRGERAEP